MSVPHSDRRFWPLSNDSRKKGTESSEGSSSFKLKTVIYVLFPIAIVHFPGCPIARQMDGSRSHRWERILVCHGCVRSEFKQINSRNNHSSSLRNAFEIINICEQKIISCSAGPTAFSSSKYSPSAAFPMLIGMLRSFRCGSKRAIEWSDRTNVRMNCEIFLIMTSLGIESVNRRKPR